MFNGLGRLIFPFRMWLFAPTKTRIHLTTLTDGGGTDDDHPVIRKMVTATLKAEPGFDVIGEVENGMQAVDKAGAERSFRRRRRPLRWLKPSRLLFAMTSFSSLNKPLGELNSKFKYLVVPASLIARYHPRSEQTWCENSLSRCSFSSRRDSSCVRPVGGRVSGNLHVHTLHSYPRRLSICASLRSADLAKRGFAISAFKSVISFWRDLFDSRHYKGALRRLIKLSRSGHAIKRQLFLCSFLNILNILSFGNIGDSETSLSPESYLCLNLSGL
jgi:hypothetical protein